MLTKKSAGAATAQGRLARAVSGMHGRTIDRRTFLKRSGVTAGATAFASQLPYGAIGKAEAAPAAAQEPVEPDAPSLDDPNVDDATGVDLALRELGATQIGEIEH